MFDQFWNTDTQPGTGDNDPILEITREFSLTQQSELGYFQDFREPFFTETVDDLMAGE